MTDQSLSYYAYAQSLQIVKTTITDIRNFSVSAGRKCAGSCSIIVPDPLQLFTKTIVRGAYMVLDWGWVGKSSLDRIFRGFISDEPQFNERSGLWTINAVGLGVLVSLRKITETYIDLTPTEIVQTWCSEMGFKSPIIYETDIVLDKLPLNKISMADALKAIDQRLGLGCEWWFDLDMKFHWEPPDYEQAPVASVVWGQHIIDFKRDGDEYILTLERTHLDHSKTIDVTDKDGEARRFFIDRFLHFDSGSKFYLKEMPMPEETAEEDAGA